MGAEGEVSEAEEGGMTTAIIEKRCAWCNEIFFGPEKMCDACECKNRIRDVGVFLNKACEAAQMAYLMHRGGPQSQAINELKLELIGKVAGVQNLLRKLEQ